MKKYQFKTNINCGSCVSKITPVLEAREGIQNWKVDTSVKDKVLLVETDVLSGEEIVSTVEEAGFKATLI